MMTGAKKRANDLAMSLPLKAALRRAVKFFFFYTSGLILSLWLAYEVRFDFEIPSELKPSIPQMLLGVIPLQLFWLHCFHQFHMLPAYFGIPGLIRMFWALCVSAATLGFLRWQFGVESTPPRGVILIDFLLSLAVLSSMCIVWRLYREGFSDRFFGFRGSSGKRRRRVAIVGAGNAGITLAQQLHLKGDLGLDPVLFFDDDPNKWDALALGVRVLGPPELLRNGVVESYQIEEIILSMPSAPSQRIKEVVEILQETGLKYKTVPSLGELAQGKYEVSQLRSVQIEDLLGREPVQLQTERIRQMLRGRCVMVTGAGGSIGSELCRQIAAEEPAQLLLVDRCEVQLFSIEQELICLGYHQMIRPLVADILDEPRMREIFKLFKPDLLFHSAAHKHVPMMESQPGEAIKNNTLGTLRLGELSVEFGVDRFVLISTDKAINPTSVMGATKRLAEMSVQALNTQNPGRTRFMAVRFGNVLGSSGSVIPLFRQQIAAGGPVTVTHPEMTRFFMTIPEAVGLVLQSSMQGTGGEIFVLDMGSPVRILDLANQMIRLSGFEPDKDIKIRFSGIRPGEKLFEEISYSSESVTPTEHPKIMRLRGAAPTRTNLKLILDLLTQQLHDAEPDQLKRALKEAVPEYKPHLPDRQTKPTETVSASV